VEHSKVEEKHIKNQVIFNSFGYIYNQRASQTHTQYYGTSS
jgi:hypothetical protein